MKNLIRIVVGTLLGLCIIVFVLTFLARKNGHPNVTVSDFVPNAVKAAVEPWNTRAQVTLGKMLQGKDASTIAASAINCVHPTGKNPSLSAFEVRPNGNGISTKFEISWQGGFTSTAYKTIIVWECNNQSHVRASASQDTAPVQITAEAQKKLDEYFRTEIYPVLCQNLK